MIIDIPDDNSIVKWKKNDNDEWKSAEISDLIKAYEKRPKGDLISRKVVKGLISDKSIPIKFEEEKRGNWQNSSGVLLSDVYKVIDNAPTIPDRTEEVLSLQNTIARLVKGIAETARPKGEWEFYEEDPDDDDMTYYRCSVCGRLIHAEETELLKNYPFCHCGADMRGEK